jgi:hypothetical protein
MNRAQSHADDLQRESDAWFGRHPYELFGEYQPGPPERYVYRVRFFEGLPAEWGIILGDFAHNARSALDHLADALVRLNNGAPTERTQFPIVLSPFDWLGQLYRLEGVSERHVEFIERLQPYHRPDFYGFSSGLSAIEDPLAILNRLSNVDKHRVLNATPARIGSISWDVRPRRDIEWVNSNKLEVPRDALEDGEVLISFDVRANGPNPELELQRTEVVEISVKHRVTLTRDGIWTEWDVPLKESVAAILGRLRHIFQVFVAEFR